VTTTCPHCGAILRAESSVCSYCDSRLTSSFDKEPPLSSRTTVPPPARGNLALEPEWRAELSQRLNAYRKRHPRAIPDPEGSGQARLPFDSPEHEEPGEISAARAAVAVDSPPEEDFAFTLAIGRRSPAEAAAALQRSRVERVDIDLTMTPSPEAEPAVAVADDQAGARASCIVAPLFPIASLGERATAAIVDAIFLLFSYGGFLALFASLGGQFSFSKLSAAVYLLAFALFYLQYFALFTVFGGTTPGMMLRGLQVVSLTGPDGLEVGDRPAPRQLLLRSLGYMLSAGIFFLGFLWACWDEDHLTWHDRMSRTYLAAADALPHCEVTR
jgi:uncharacterized RDD family membrane protein YckC